ncbi:MAG: hypothetical protein NZU63_02345 [Gemmataceae bacterium]|nr:hypothetical protein [Gemmataceae bacterium]
MLLPAPPPPVSNPCPLFAAAAQRLLKQSQLWVARHPCRLCEIEFYWYASEHPDPFCHRHPLQLQQGRWYFHRIGSAYRGGSFKGLDVTFSDGHRYGGILFRGLQLPAGHIVSGPSRLVDTILQLTGYRHVAELDARLQQYHAEDPDAPVTLRPTEQPLTVPVYATARVGLVLRHDRVSPAGLRFFARPYRFLIHPRALAAGRPQLIVALHQHHSPPSLIHTLTGSPQRTIQDYLDNYEKGKQCRTPARYLVPLIGRPLHGRQLCLLYGLLAQLCDYPDDHLDRLLRAAAKR